MGISQWLLFPFILCGEDNGHSYLTASKDDFFIMNPNSTESAQLAECPLLQLTS